MSVLYLTLKKKWFDMVNSMQKREEYRELKPYWHKRIGPSGKKYTSVQFRNGYSPTSPVCRFELVEILSGLGITEWGAPDAEAVYILRLGKRLETTTSAGRRREQSEKARRIRAGRVAGLECSHSATRRAVHCC